MQSHGTQDLVFKEEAGPLSGHGPPQWMAALEHRGPLKSKELKKCYTGTHLW